MSTNLETLYDILTVWFSRFDGINDIRITMNEFGLIVQASFINEHKDVQSQMMVISKVITKMEMEHLSPEVFDEMERSIMNEFERQHMIWEVGEE